MFSIDLSSPGVLEGTRFMNVHGPIEGRSTMHFRLECSTCVLLGVALGSHCCQLLLDAREPLDPCHLNFSHKNIVQTALRAGVKRSKAIAMVPQDKLARPPGSCYSPPIVQHGACKGCVEIEQN